MHTGQQANIKAPHLFVEHKQTKMQTKRHLNAISLPHTFVNQKEIIKINKQICYSRHIPKPRAATSVATKIGALPDLKSQKKTRC